MTDPLPEALSAQGQAVTTGPLLRECIDRPSRLALIEFFQALEHVVQKRLTRDAVPGEYVHSECSEASAKPAPGGDVSIKLMPPSGSTAKPRARLYCYCWRSQTTRMMKASPGQAFTRWLESVGCRLGMCSTSCENWNGKVA